MSFLFQVKENQTDFFSEKDGEGLHLFIGNTLNADKAFTERLGEASLTEVDDVEDCDIILAFCPISSRADIGEALQRIPDYKPAILVMIHHTSDPNYIVPENRNEIRSDTSLASLTKVDHVEDCDIILAFCPISSRADIGEALQRIPDYKPAILVMIHHTYDPNYIVPENRNEIRSDVLAVDILFHEKKGLLKCQRNDSAVDTVRRKLNLQQPVWEQDRR
ncbi:hypothetical protein AAFF_G00179140 [Aldrovandia affinis]|uniref:Uncharacterized protein n=1 Tax=Aldrovandia affinis TaxID=143900 RepID=A0AAD7RKS4_9TELE|nr:hypothetical protein AAFF_G00179140 [Aldrovandia affinis]